MRELNVNEVKEVNGGGSFFYSLGYYVGLVFKPAEGDVDCNIAP